MSDDRALLMAIPLRHLQSAVPASGESTILPAGGPGDLDAAAPGMPLIVMATDAGDTEVPAATWGATLVRRVPYEPGAPWPEGLPPTWVEEHQPVVVGAADPGREDDDDWDDEDGDDDDDDGGPQSFLEVVQLEPLPRESWLFANELVGKQARRGRTFRPRVPTIVNLPD